MAGKGADCCGSWAHICRAKGWVPCGAPESAGAMAGTGADSCGSGARIAGAEGWAPCGAPGSTGAMAGRGRIAAALGRAMMVVVPRVAVGS